MSRNHGGPCELQHLEEAVAFLSEGSEYLLTSHINTDADGLGACLALRRVLRRMGKQAIVVIPQEPSPQLGFLNDFASIRQATDETCRARFRRAIVVDCSDLARIGEARGCIAADARILNVDHHGDNSLFGQVNLVAPVGSSACEVAYHLTLATGVEVDPQMAALLCAGILFDTGGFRYASTTPETLEVAAELVRRGARLDLLAERLFHTRGLAAVRSIGTGLSSLELALDGRVAILSLPRSGCEGADAEVIVDYGLQVEGVEVSVLLRQEQDGGLRVSLRSKGAVDVHAVASELGGGGHTRAAGCRLEGQTSDLRDGLLKAIARHLEDDADQA